MDKFRRKGHSELIGSFIRTGNYPIEADYIFETVDELMQYYADPINITILHNGLLRVVLNDEGHQVLYWVVSDGEDLTFKPLIKDIDIENILNEIDGIKEKLDNDEAKIQALEELTQKLQETQNKLKEIVIKIVGNDDFDTIDESIEGLNFKSLVIIDKFLSYFWSEDPEKRFDVIANWDALNKLFEGIDTKKPLKDTLHDLYISIMGDEHLDPKYNTLLKIRQFLKDLDRGLETLNDEINKVETAVGLHATGLYKSDPSTKHINNATSVMDALSILDRLIDEAIQNSNIKEKDTPTINLTINRYRDYNEVYADAKISDMDGNILLVKENGLYAMVDMNYDKGVIDLLVNGEVRKSINLGLSFILKKAYYSVDEEAIIMTFKTLDEDQEMRIPVSNLISEWEVDNSQSNKVVALEKVRVEGQGADKLSADVRIHPDKYNILTKVGNALYVKGTADNIVHNDVKVGELLDALNSSIEDNKETLGNIDKKLDAEINRSTNKDDLLEKAQEALQEKVNTISDKVSENLSKIEGLEKAHEKLVLDVKAAEEHINDLRNDMNDKQVETDEKINAVKTDLAQTKKDVAENTDKIDAEVEAGNERAEKIKKILEDIKQIKLENAKFKEITEAEYEELDKSDSVNRQTIYFIKDKEYVYLRGIKYGYREGINLKTFNPSYSWADWVEENYPHDDTSGRIVYTDNNGKTFKAITSKHWKSTLGTPVGVEVIPASHNVYGDGSTGILSLDEEHNGFRWDVDGFGNNDIPEIGNFKNLPIVDPETGEIHSDNFRYAVFSTNAERKNKTIKNKLDKGSSWVFNYHNKTIPSPYNLDGSRNSKYYQNTDPMFNDNLLSDFNGLGNTKSIISVYGNEHNYVAKSVHKITNNIEWYLPTISELGYVSARVKGIEDSLGILNKNKISIALRYFSSSEIDNTKIYVCDISGGNIVDLEKNKTYAATRGFARVMIEK